MAYKMVAFGFSDIVVNFRNAENAWDLIRNIYQIPDIWKDYQEGKIGRQTAKSEEYKLWKSKGVKLDGLMINLRKNMKLVQGATEVFSTLSDNRISIAILSDSPHIVVDDVSKQLGAKYFSCNKVLFNKDGFAYETIPTHPSADGRVSKILALKDFANRENIRLSEIAVVGNDKGDLDVFRFAGRSIAFNPKDTETKKAAHVIVSSKTLEDVMEYLK